MGTGQWTEAGKDELAQLQIRSSRLAGKPSVEGQSRNSGQYPGNENMALTRKRDVEAVHLNTLAGWDAILPESSPALF